MISPAASQEDETINETPDNSQQDNSHITDNLQININPQGTDLRSQRRDQTFQGNGILPRKKKMTRVLYFIENDDIEKIFNDDSLYYYFLKICVINVITRTKWKENCTTYDYDQFVHPTDEAFALLVIENNSKRYNDMVERPGLNGEEYVSPKFTTITRNKVSDKRSQVRGWSDSGKMRFLEYTKMIRRQRSNKIWVDDTKKMVKRRCKRDYKTRKKRKDMNDDDNDLRSKRMNREDRNEWKTFQTDNLNYDNWNTQI